MAKDTIWEAKVAADSAGPDDSQPIPWEDQERRAMLCRSCHLPRVFRRRRTHHSIHFILSLITFGVWLPVWGINIILQLRKPWTCSVCGIHQRDH